MKTTLATASVILVALCAVASAASVTGSSQPDVLVGTDGPDLIVSMGGNDLVLGLGGHDRIDGGSGDDVLRGDGICPPGAKDPSYCSSGGTGNDIIDGAGGRDVIAGEAGNDDLTGGPGADQLEGGPGNDVIDAKDGKRDVVRCGPGRDRVIVDRRDRVSRDCERRRRRR